MKDLELEGKLVYLTVHYDKWLREVNSDFNIPMANRLARIIKVFDWDSEEGLLLHKARTSTNKWGNFNPKDFKFVLKVYCPELRRQDKKLGFSTEEVVPRCYPGTEMTMFDVVPEWMLEQITSDKWDVFKVLQKKSEVQDLSVTKDPVKKVTKKKILKSNVSR
jgi:hypothetical protein